MPKDTNAERSILGAILVDNKYLAEVLEENLARDHFHDIRHSIIFKGMADLVARGERVDLITLSDELRKNDQLEQAGAEAYIAKLGDEMPRLCHPRAWARIVRRKAIYRGFIYASGTLEHAAYEGDRLDADPASIAKIAIQRLSEISASQSGTSAWREIFHTVEEFTNAKPLTFAIDGFLQTDAATMFAGPSGQSKTLLQLSTVKSLLMGEKLWDLFAVKEKAARVLYLIPESALGPFNHRIRLFGLTRFVECDQLLVRTLSKGPTPQLSDPRILQAAKGADVFLDTASRFGEGDENSSGDNQRGLATDIFALLGAGARLVVIAHHAPKNFVTQTTMTLENVARGSGDITAMLATCWGIRQLDPDRNIVYVQNVKPRDFEPCRPFQLIGRPFIDDEGDFRVYKRPGDSGFLQDELKIDRDLGGAPQESRQERTRRVALVRDLLADKPNLTRNEVVLELGKHGINVKYETARNYISAAKEGK